VIAITISQKEVEEIEQGINNYKVLPTEVEDMDQVS
jgi:hypothetical protein